MPASSRIRIAERTTLRIGIDVGGTFTDFLVVASAPGRESPDDGATWVVKTPSTPDDPSRGLLEGLSELAQELGMSLPELGRRVETIVHGTTVTTNAVLTRSCAKTGLLTTRGVRDALEMRRGVREEQYNNRYANVVPLVPRYLRLPVTGRLDREGNELEGLVESDILAAAELFEREGVESVAICFMNSYASPTHERRAAAIMRERLPGAYSSVSSTLLPAIRFYDRVSTTVLNAAVGPKLRSYMDALVKRLADIDFRGVLRIMQSNGGVVAPDVVRDRAAMTLLSGPAAGPRAGAYYAAKHGLEDCITVDMGGTSFDAALLRRGEPLFATEGEIERLRLALPMLDIATIGAGGGSIAWIDSGGLLRMGPQSAGADPGPACYGRGGTLPTCTDADAVLGYLPTAEFAGGRIRLDVDAARRAIEQHVARPMTMSVEQAAVGMARVIDANMAAGVRAVSVRRGIDPRELPLVVAGGAGPQHCCAICAELEIPLFLVPRQSSIFCAAGMLMSDLLHDDVRSVPARLDQLGPGRIDELISEMIDAAKKTLRAENVKDSDMEFQPSLDMRYVKQHHEVNVSFPLGAKDVGQRFHLEHDRRFGYHLEDQGTALEVINLRLRSIGRVQPPKFPELPSSSRDPERARKGARRAYVPETRELTEIPVFDADAMEHGMRLVGPALVDQANTTIFLSAAYGLVVDKFGNFLGYRLDRVGTLPRAVAELVS
ncbi:MAG: hydantoinase/oxoprolinase family protein [Deltaproteobacteria bacterium]|nr:hydantoinase/oxoprolinase family protein [Deltaproteobacteria bacterium]